ncbi:MAG: hypothetical protein SFU25_06310 [Candidatus Caenarcaniphilales bacterium]|nr:hypothetical protein [Candidatus Caenarcaniphilales bacterium]
MNDPSLQPNIVVARRVAIVPCTDLPTIRIAYVLQLSFIPG